MVILPETAKYTSPANGPRVMVPQDGPPLWPSSKDDMPAAMRRLAEAEKAAEEAEQDRLLYVAMTRAATQSPGTMSNASPTAKRM
ncbi:MAG: hypothetical protein AAFV62_11190, partial [Pseudomonadota bacterium]